MPLRAVEDARARETLLTIDLGARHQPFRGLVLEAADPLFFRGVLVEVRSQPASPRDQPWWRPLAEGELIAVRAGASILPMQAA